MNGHDAAASPQRPLFIGCACDRKFVEPTATMLTSLDMNGDVSDATVLLAAFELDELDRQTLRVAAGRLGARMRFIDVNSDMLAVVDTGSYTEIYPPPVLGRLFLADHADVSGGRLLTLDSDMIVNQPVRPLFERDLSPHFFAAIHDPPSAHDPHYFNSGLTLFDIDAYRAHDVAGRSFRWLADQANHPRYPDQDALNHVLGDDWHRLEQSWNHFCYAPHHFEPRDWEACRVSHFAGPKPWVRLGHAGERLYYRYNSELHARLASAGVKPRFVRAPRIDAVLCWDTPGVGLAALKSAVPVFIGCVCDETSVESAAVTLTSLDVNGDLPDAPVLIASADLTESDKVVLKIACGRRYVQFVDVRQDTAYPSNGSSDRPNAPYAGRLLCLARHVPVPGARLITLEAGMIVNADLKRLAYVDLGTSFLAGVAGLRRDDGRERIESDMLLFDVDVYKYHDIGPRTYQWMLDHHGSVGDGLIEIIGDIWHRLPQTWSYGRKGDVRHIAEDYEMARIASPKNIDRRPDHPARPLYDRYLRVLRDRIAVRSDLPPVGSFGVDRDFVATCYEIFLGRELESEQVVRDRRHLSPAGMIASVIDSDEFRHNVEEPLRQGRPIASHVFQHPPTRRQMFWIMDRLDMSSQSRVALADIRDWNSLHTLLLADRDFLDLIGLN